MRNQKKARRRGRSERKTAPTSAREKIEKIHRQWQTERPDINPDPVRIYGLVSRIQTQTTACIDAVLARYRLVRGTFDVLTALRRAGKPFCLSPKELTQHLVLSGAGLNGRLNTLERLRYIARLPEPSDRRSLRIQLTAAGERVVDAATPRVFEMQWQMLSGFKTRDRKAFADYLFRLADAVDALQQAAETSVEPDS